MESGNIGHEKLSDELVVCFVLHTWTEININYFFKVTVDIAHTISSTRRARRRRNSSTTVTFEARFFASSLATNNAEAKGSVLKAKVPYPWLKSSLVLQRFADLLGRIAFGRLAVGWNLAGNRSMTNGFLARPTDPERRRTVCSPSSSVKSQWNDPLGDTGASSSCSEPVDSWWDEVSFTMIAKILNTISHKINIFSPPSNILYLLNIRSEVNNWTWPSF